MYLASVALLSVDLKPAIFGWVIKVHVSIHSNIAVHIALIDLTLYIEPSTRFFGSEIFVKSLDAIEVINLLSIHIR
jgi:hypothetical protein